MLMPLRLLVLTAAVWTTVAFSPSLVSKVSLQPQQKNHQYTLSTLQCKKTITKLYAATLPTKDDSSDTGKSSINNNEKDTTVDFDVESQRQLLLGVAIPYEQLTIGVLKETYPGENRVSQTPDSVRTLIKAGMNVVVQTGGTLHFRILMND
jgi:Alanine dehydrogenase/PNT, N-terminal domain